MIDNRVNTLRSWRGMRYIRLVPFASLFLFVVFVHVVYIKLSGDNDIFMTMIDSGILYSFITCALFVLPDSVCRYKDSDRKGAISALSALLNSLLGLFLRLVFLMLFLYITSILFYIVEYFIAQSPDFDGRFSVYLLPVWALLSLFCADILFYFSERWKKSPHRFVRGSRRVFVWTLSFIFWRAVGMMFLSSFIVYDKSLATRSVNRLRTVKSAVLMAWTDKTQIPLGEFHVGSFQRDVVDRYLDRSMDKGVILFSADLADPNKSFFLGFSDWGTYDDAKNKKELGERLEAQASQSALYGSIKGDYFRSSDTLLLVNGGGLLYSLEGWVLISSDRELRLQPYWDAARAQRILDALPRTDESVTVIVESRGEKREGMGSSVRAAVANALPGDVPFASPDITKMTVYSNNDYRLHEFNADVFGDDLCFIRTTLKNLEHLDLSRALFYGDTIPRSAFDSSKNVEYAFRLPKGDLTKLARIDLPPSIVSVDAYAFRNLTALNTIDLPNVKSIGSEAFEGCRLLATVDAPKVQKVGAGAFFACDSLKEDVPRSRAVRNDDDR